MSVSFFIIIANTLAGKYLHVRVTGLSFTESYVRDQEYEPDPSTLLTTYIIIITIVIMKCAWHQGHAGIVYIAMFVFTCLCVCVHGLECTYSDYSN